MYTNREEKLKYVWGTYQTVLRGASILDVGADACHLKGLLDAGARYWGIGRGGKPDQVLDLDTTPYPFAAGAFDVVLCLDVLEHLEHPHAAFDELCRIAGRHVIIALPNPLASLWHRLLRYGAHQPGQLMKYYGLPPDPPDDRHRWFFDADEAQRFICERAARCGWSVRQMVCEPVVDDSRHWSARLRRALPRFCLHKSVAAENLQTERVWALLEKPE